MSKLIPTEAEVAEFLSGTKADGEVRLIESRTFGVEEVCRAFAVPSHLAGSGRLVGGYDLGAAGVDHILPINHPALTRKF